MKYSREEQLLLACAGLEMTPTQRRAVELCLEKGALDWGRLVQEADWLHVSGLVYRNLRDEGFLDSVPDKARLKLRNTYLTNAARNNFRGTELAKALRSLRDAGIDVIVLKGAALLSEIYEDPGIRPMVDFDILVREEDADAAQSLVVQLGYRPVGDQEEQESTRAAHRHLPTLVNWSTRVAIEVHTHIVSRNSPLRCNIDDFWRRAQTATIAGVEVRILAPSDQLIHLAINFFLDRRYRSEASLQQIVDLAAVLRHYEADIDWEALELTVQRYGLQGPVYCGLSVASHLLQTSAPPETLDRIRPHAFSESAMHRFIKARVMTTDRVMASEWVNPKRAYSIWNLATGVSRRILANPSYLRRRYSSPETATPLWRLYVDRFTDGGSLLLRNLLRPLRIWRELRVDRWIHALQDGGPQTLEGHEQARLPYRSLPTPGGP